jgi:hypothetical protein
MERPLDKYKPWRIVHVSQFSQAYPAFFASGVYFRPSIGHKSTPGED